MIWLFDGNVLVAMMLESHVHHDRVHRWLANISDDQFSTCAVTEGTLLRMHMLLAADKSAEAAWEALRDIHAQKKHIFWANAPSYVDLSPLRLTGYRQITDSWLADLAKRKGGKLATLDEGLSALWPQSALLIPR